MREQVNIFSDFSDFNPQIAVSMWSTMVFNKMSMTLINLKRSIILKKEFVGISFFNKKLMSGERIHQNWLVYSKSTGLVFYALMIRKVTV